LESKRLRTTALKKSERSSDVLDAGVDVKFEIEIQQERFRGKERRPFLEGM